MVSTSHLLSQVCIVENGLAAEKVGRIYIPKTGKGVRNLWLPGSSLASTGGHILSVTSNNSYDEWGQLSIQTQEQRFTYEKICKTCEIWTICVEIMLRVLNQGEGNVVLNKAGFIHLRVLKETLLQLEQLRKACFVNQNWIKGKPILNEVWDVWSSTIMFRKKMFRKRSLRRLPLSPKSQELHWWGEYHLPGSLL